MSRPVHLAAALISGLLLVTILSCPEPGDDDMSVSPSPAPVVEGETGTPTPAPVTGTPEDFTPSASPTPGATESPTGTPEASAPPFTPTPGSDADSDGFARPDDCDDTDPSVYPGAEEIPYDGTDQDCNGTDLTDVDGDGYPGVPAGGDDCNDQNAATHPGADEVVDGEDNDCDGFVDEGADETDDDEDGYSEADGDCDDTDATAYPGAEEVPYDGIDQDCDGTDLADLDGDGHPGASAGGDDCDDTDPSVHPGAEEIPYDFIDQDCDGTDLADLDGDGALGGAYGIDCDDTDPAVYPGAEEIPYDGVDQDCDGADITDADGDGQAAEAAGGADCDDTDPSVYFGADEIPYDGIDQDCNGEDPVDVDADGYPATEVGGDDCDDLDANTHPDAEEFADGKDNDCDGQVDENLSTTDDDGDGQAESDGDCNDYDPTIYPGADEVPYDGIDQDCNGTDLTDVDGDGYDATEVSGQDCNDDDPATYPGAEEIPYDGIDQDCNGDDLVDVDGDGYPGAPTGGDDCDDTDPAIHPDAPETPYDGVDQDCNGTDLTDVDGDGHDALAAGGDDCQDNDPTVSPAADEVCDGADNNCDGIVDTDAVDRIPFHVDGDHDGFGDPDQTELACAPSETLVEDATDCDDSSALTYPGAEETCDEQDNDCDGQVDEGVQTTFYLDADGDGHGDPDTPVLACARPEGTSDTASDCDDNNPSVNPDAEESCNEVDDDCDGEIDEGVKTTFYRDMDQDGYGVTENAIEACSAPQGFVAEGGDCRDTNDFIYPGAPERCNGLDDDCDGLVDEDVNFAYYVDADGDGYGDPAQEIRDCNAPPGTTDNGTDCDDTDPAVHPDATEVCNGIDDDCDSSIDEGVTPTWYFDRDQDGYGTPDDAVTACTAPSGYVDNDGDCDDNNAVVHMDAPEVCDNLDNDCDGDIDEQTGNTYYLDNDGDLFGTPDVQTVACSAPTGYVGNDADCDDDNPTTYPGAAEQCNGIDDDCDGLVDENVRTTYYQDLDGDGYGNPDVSTLACDTPDGFVMDASDCRDTNDAVYPGAQEVCNDIDDDCDGLVDESIRTDVTIEGGAFAPSSGGGCFCGAVSSTPIGACTTSCGCTCSTNNHLDYVLTTQGGRTYDLTVRVADYFENCVNVLVISVWVNGSRIGSWTGSGVGDFVEVPFSFTASSTSTTIQIYEDNDYCCGCYNNCYNSCSPKYEDQNMYIDWIHVKERCI